MPSLSLFFNCRIESLFDLPYYPLSSTPEQKDHLDQQDGKIEHRHKQISDETMEKILVILESG